MKILKTHFLQTLMYLTLLANTLSAQTIININDGQTLTEDDLLALEFDGMPFSLGTNTFFEINDGGKIGTDQLNAGVQVFDFEDSVVNVNSGGTFIDKFAAVSNTTVNVFDAGMVGYSTSFENSRINVFPGAIVEEFSARTDSNINISGGTVVGLSADDTKILISNGSVGGINTENNSDVDITGGKVGGVSVSTGSNLDVSNGSLSGINVRSASTADMSGGLITNRTSIQSGGTANFSGGGISAPFFARSGSNVSLSGGEFLLNGAPYNASSITLTENDIFSGTLSDGSSFIISAVRTTYGMETVEGVNLIQAALPTLDTTPITVTSTSGQVPFGLREGQTLSVFPGGELGANFSVVKATLNVNGGEVGAGLEVFDGELNVSSGNVGGEAQLYSGSVTNISGGNVGGFLDAYEDSTVNISGGKFSSFVYAGPGSKFNISGGELENFSSADSTINISGGEITGLSNHGQSTINFSGGHLGNRFGISSGTTMNMSGGTIGHRFDTKEGSTLNITGGSFGNEVDFHPDSNTTIYGGEFKANGVPVSDSTLSLIFQGVFTGTLADGSTFIFSLDAGDSLQQVNLVQTPLPPLDLNPKVINASSGPGPQGLRAGQSLTLEDGGKLNQNFAVVEATLNIEGGMIGEGLEAYDSTINVTGGDIGDNSYLHEDSVLNISGGNVGVDLITKGKAVVNMSGGSIGEEFSLSSESTLNISGGKIDIELRANGSTVNMTGGSIGEGVDASGATFSISGGNLGSNFNTTEFSNVTIRGNEFYLNGNPYNGTTITLADSDVFTGILEDGSVFIFAERLGDDLYDANLVLTTTAPSSSESIVIDASDSPFSKGLRRGQSLLLENGGELSDNFAILGATLTVNDGFIGNGLKLLDSEANILGGTIGTGLKVFDGSILNIYGGEFGDRLTVLPGGAVSLFVKDLKIGQFEQDYEVGTRLVFDSPWGTNINPFIATLRDGSTIVIPRTSFQTGSTLTVFFVPEPSSCLLMLSGLALMLRRRRHMHD